LSRIWIVGREPAHVAALSEALQGRGLPAEIAEGEAAVRAADIIVTATTATAPLFDADWAEPGTHISSMGSDSLAKQELPPMLFPRARLFCDLTEQSARIGEFQHVTIGAVLTAVGAVLSGGASGRQSDDEITIFDNSGISLQDIQTAKTILDATGTAGTHGGRLRRCLN
jgi:ornithine cyclodeaminase